MRVKLRTIHMLERISLFVVSIAAFYFRLLHHARAHSIIFLPQKRSTFANWFHISASIWGYCSGPWALPSSRTFKKHAMDSAMVKILANMGFDVRGCFPSGLDRKFIALNLKPVFLETDNAPMKIINIEVAI